MDHLTFEIYRTFLDERRGFQDAKENIEKLRFISFLTRIDATIIYLLGKSCGRHINRESVVFLNTLQGVPYFLQRN